MGSAGRWCVRHRTLVVLVWLVALIGIAVADQLAGSSYTTQFQLPDTPSAAALKLLQRDFPAASGDTDQIVLHATSVSPSARCSPRSCR